MVKTPSPGYYRLMLGDFEVTALLDGAIDLQPTKLLTHTTPAQVNKLLARSFEKEPLPTSVNAYLINTGSKLVLVDAGTGWLEAAQEAGLVYGGFSAGSAIASAWALVGGWRATARGREIEVCHEDCGEDLDAVTVRPGLGLVPFTVDLAPMERRGPFLAQHCLPAVGHP